MALAMAHGATIRYHGSGSWDKLEGVGQTEGWQSATPPGPADTVRANWGGNTVTLDYETSVGRFQIGVDESGTFHVLNGGTLHAASGNKVGNNNNCTGTLLIDAGGTVNANGGWMMIAGSDLVTGIAEVSGTLDIEGHLWMATGSGSSASLTINPGGVVNVGANIGLGTIAPATAPTGGPATITVNMSGTLNLHHWDNTGSIRDGSVLNINQGGVVTIGGNRVSAANDYFAAGKIASDLGAIEATFNPGADLTTIIAVPEPATLGLLGAFGAIGLLRRRRS
jgi:hypothetical protein